MSTEQRIVPVVLQVGKKYVRRNGEVVTIVHTADNGQYTFEDSDGRWLTADGRWHLCPREGGYEHDIVRPHYQVGETYIDGHGNERTLVANDHDGVKYPLGCNGSSWTSAGVMYSWSPGINDLQDYAPAVAVVAPVPNSDDVLLAALEAPEVLAQYGVPVFNPKGGIPIPPPSTVSPPPEAWQPLRPGDRVSLLNMDKLVLGTVVDVHDPVVPNLILVVRDDGCGHNAQGQWHSNTGWWVTNSQYEEGNEWERSELVGGFLVEPVEPPAPLPADYAWVVPSHPTSAEVFDEDDRAAVWNAWVAAGQAWPISRFIEARKELLKA